jgi:DTW domain-containing protein YfiP
MPYLVEAADGTVLATSEPTYDRAESTARLYVAEQRVETRVVEWRETPDGPKTRELWCATDYPATVRFPAAA